MLFCGLRDTQNVDSGRVQRIGPSSLPLGVFPDCFSVLFRDIGGFGFLNNALKPPGEVVSIVDVRYTGLITA